MHSSDGTSARPARVELVICTGTACYVMGGSELLLAEEALPADLRDRVRISGAPCMGRCRHSPEEGHPRHRTPCITVNGVPHDGVDLAETIRLVREACDVLEQ